MSGKNETKLFFVISLIKPWRFRWNLVHSLWNKFAAKFCKRFSPHLNNVSALPCETWNAHCARATVELLEKETPEFIASFMWPPHSTDLNPVDYRMWGILQEKVFKITYSLLIWTNWNSDWEVRTEWAKLDHVVIAAAIHHGVVDRSRSVTRVLYIFSCNIPNTLWSIGFKSDEFGGHSWDGMLLFLTTQYSTCAMSISSFTR